MSACGCSCFCVDISTLFFFSLFLRFSEVFDFVARNSHDDVFYEDDIWPGEDENGCVLIRFRQAVEHRFFCIPDLAIMTVGTVYCL